MKENRDEQWAEWVAEQRAKEGKTMEEYKMRMVEEFETLKMRHERLRDLCNRIEAAEMMKYAERPIKEPPHDCPLDLLRRQKEVMGEYLHILEIRAIIEGVDLHAVKGE